METATDIGRDVDYEESEGRQLSHSKRACRSWIMKFSLWLQVRWRQDCPTDWSRW